MNQCPFCDKDVSGGPRSYNMREWVYNYDFTKHYNNQPDLCDSHKSQYRQLLDQPVKKLGRKIKLKSDGIIMDVTSSTVDLTSYVEKITCKWSVDGELHMYDFDTMEVDFI